MKQGPCGGRQGLWRSGPGGVARFSLGMLRRFSGRERKVYLERLLNACEIDELVALVSRLSCAAGSKLPVRLTSKCATSGRLWSGGRYLCGDELLFLAKVWDRMQYEGRPGSLQ